MGLPYNVQSVRSAPSMWLPVVSYDTVSAFLAGVDAASDGGFLRGFREWLVVKCDGGNNLHWTEHILYLAFPQEESPRKALGGEQAQRRAIEQLFQHLEEFYTARCDQDGMRHIYVRYQRWLEQQEWYPSDI